MVRVEKSTDLAHISRIVMQVNAFFLQSVIFILLEEI